jgi:hypothetical protein
MPINALQTLAMLAALILLVHARGLRKRTKKRAAADYDYADIPEGYWGSYNKTITPQIAELFDVIFGQLEESRKSECGGKRDQLELVEYYRNVNLEIDNDEVVLIYYCNASRQIEYVRATQTNPQWKQFGIRSTEQVTQQTDSQLLSHSHYEALVTQSGGAQEAMKLSLIDAMTTSTPLFEHCEISPEQIYYDIIHISTKEENDFKYWKTVVDISCTGLPQASGEVEFSKPQGDEAFDDQLTFGYKVVGFNFIPE